MMQMDLIKETRTKPIQEISCSIAAKDHCDTFLLTNCHICRLKRTIKEMTISNCKMCSCTFREPIIDFLKSDVKAAIELVLCAKDDAEGKYVMIILTNQNAPYHRTRPKAV